jgi:lysophospholipase L1-like esterase
MTEELKAGGAPTGGGRLKRIMANAALVTASVGLVFALSLGADRIVGAKLLRRPVPGAMELVFPPNSKMEFETPQFHYTANINSFGYRDREFSSLKKDSFKIAVLGDSFTYGWGVELEQAWVKLLEKNLQQAGLNVETINLGRPGGDPAGYAETAERAIPVLRPDMVIVGMLQADDLAAVGGGDPSARPEPAPALARFAELCWPRFVEALRHRQGKVGPVTDTQGIHGALLCSAEQNNKGQAEIARNERDKLPPDVRARFDALEEKVRTQFLEGTLNPCLVASAVRGPNFLLDFANEGDSYAFVQCVERSARSMARVKKVAALYGARLLGVSVPLGAYVNRAALDSYRRVGYKVSPELVDSDVPDRAVAAVFAGAGAPCFSVTDAFRAHKDDPTLFFELDGHFTAAGHALFGKLLSTLLKTELQAHELSGK